MSYDTITVPEFSAATVPSLTDLLWLSQGTGASRDKKLTLELLKDYFLDFVADQRIGYLEGYFKNDIPSVFGDRTILLIGQVIEITDYQKFCAAMYCGDANNATAATFYKTSDAGGTTRSTSGTYMVLPDARGLSWKGVGDAIINGRIKIGPDELGELQEDQLEIHNHGTAAGGTTQFWTIDTDSPTHDIAFGAANVNANAQYYTGYLGSVGRSGSNTRDSSAGINWGIGY